MIRHASVLFAFTLVGFLRPEALFAVPAASPEVLWPGAFRLLQSESLPDGTWQMLADAGGSEHCQFGIKIRFATGWFGWFQSSKVTLSRMPGADCRGFLAGLTHVLRFSGAVPTAAPTQQITAVIVVLADQLVRTGNGFVPGTSGTWLTSKITLIDSASEVYLNLDETNGIGEFRIKDESYAADVIQAFESVLE